MCAPRRARGPNFLLVGAGAVWALRPAFQSSVSPGDTGDFVDPHGRFLNVTVAVYVALFCVIWAIALPGNLKADDGIAPGAGQAGSFAVALVGLLIGLTLVVAANCIHRRASLSAS